MADTPRTLSALQTILADNISADISAQDIRDFLVSVLGGYGAISTVDSASSQGSLSDVTPTLLTAFTANGVAASDVTPDHTSDDITVGVAGDYAVTLSASFAGSNLTNYILQFAVDGTPVAAYKMQRKIGTGADIGHGSLTAILTLAAGEAVSVYVSIVETPAAQTINIKHATLCLRRVG